MNTLTEARQGIVALLEARVNSDFDNNAAFEPKPIVTVRPVSFEELYPEITINQGRIYLKEQNNELNQRIQQLEQQLDMARDDSTASHREKMRLAAENAELKAALDSAKKALQQGQEKLKDALATQLAPKPKERVISEHPGELAGVKGLVRLSVIPFEETKVLHPALMIIQPEDIEQTSDEEIDEADEQLMVAVARDAFQSVRMLRQQRALKNVS